MIITISGTPGSGKSTVAKILVEKLHAERLYIGGTLRDLARKKGMTLAELMDFAKVHPEIDVEVDNAVAAQAREFDKAGKMVVVEGRMQFYFLPESIKFFIKVSFEEAARRIWKDLQQKEISAQRNEGRINSLEEMKKSVIKREEEDASRYKKLYGVDYLNEKQYDLVVDSTSISAMQCAELILNFIEKFE